MFELKNHTEVVVRNALEQYLKQNDIPCRCERCQADIMAHALNRLPPRYYVSLKGEIMTDWESQCVTDKARVMSEVVRAVQIVANSPSHPLNDKD